MVTVRIAKDGLNQTGIGTTLRKHVHLQRFFMAVKLKSFRQKLDNFLIFAQNTAKLGLKLETLLDLFIHLDIVLLIFAEIDNCGYYTC